MRFIKKIIKKIFNKKIIYHLKYSKTLYQKLYRETSSLVGLIKTVLKVRIIQNDNKGLAIKRLFNKIKLNNIDEKDNFYYTIDPFKSVYKENRLVDNLSVDYQRILNNSLEDYKEKIAINRKNEKFYNTELYTIEGIEELIDRIVIKFKKQKLQEKIINNIKNIKDKKANTFEEAIQRILFFNQLLWQTNHSLNGLGRLDMILIDYYKNDIKNGILTKEKAEELLKEFLLKLHEHYNLKSNCLLGDTGQVIELGGKDINSNYQYNELTYIFIQLMEQLKLPDPKVLLRVTKEMPRDLMEISLRCIQTGIGCPLFANDDVIIEKLIKFGYDEKDAYNYGTSACWEPYIIGKALDPNNIQSVVFMEPFELLLNNEENIEKINDKQTLINIYKEYLQKYINELIKNVQLIKLEEDPLLSLFIDNCIEKNKDISQGGAIYNHYGLTGVGLSNLVNSIINLDEIVFKNKEIGLKEINEIRKNNFDNYEELVLKLRKSNAKYGTDDQEVIKLSNDIIEYTSYIMNNYINQFGGKYKFGVSAPSYIDSARQFPASFDGRRKGEPFGVHISSDAANAYTELIQFSSKLNYNENRFNGNVVDFIISPNFINDNFEKMVDFLLLSIKVGFFEMQMNVVSSDIMIQARKNPERFPNLIVRVWGFSSYFKDLPDEYKDYLIERALQSEGNS